MILQETVAVIRKRYKTHTEDLTIAEVRIGLFLTAVKLSDGTVGLASTLMPADSEIHCKKSKRDYGDFSPLNMEGKTVMQLLEFPAKNSIIQTLQIACLNAVSTKFIENQTYKIRPNTDPLDLIDLSCRKTITIVGAFQSYIDKISQTENNLNVLEINEDALSDSDKKFFVPAADYAKILPISDVVIITGLTLVNNTLDRLLAEIKPRTQVIVTGPSSSFIPDVLFTNKVNIIGAVRITKPEVALKAVSQAAAGYHLFNSCAEKICILNE